MDIEAVKRMAARTTLQVVNTRDAILYALGIGVGSEPTNTATDLPFVYEHNLRMVPSYVDVLCESDFWPQDPQYDIDWHKLLHIEQEFAIHHTLETNRILRGKRRVSAVEDKGRRLGTLVHQTKELFDDTSGVHIASVRSTMILRGDGGQGSFGSPPLSATPLPDRAPDRSVTITTLPQQALLYRLSGDYNLLHVDPKIAARAGFPKPILHGLCTSGITCRAVLATYCRNDPALLTGMFARFAKPVFPGETIRFDFFEERERVRFR